MSTTNLPEVRLRAIEPEDLDLLYRIENDMELWNVGATNVPYSRYALHDYMANVSGDIYADRQVRFIIENEVGTVVGIIDIVNFDPRHHRAEVGIVIENQYRQKGYASSALMQVAEYAFGIIHLHQLYVIVDKYNLASINLFQKMGYIIITELKDWLYDGRRFSDAVVLQLVP